MTQALPFENEIVSFLWRPGTAKLPFWKRWPIAAARVAFAVVRDIVDGRLTLHAMSLVYTTLLSLAPLLAISFSVLKGFGVHNQFEPMLLQFLAPLGEQGVEITEYIIGFVDNIRVGVLGVVGFAMLFYTVISLIQKIEFAFNETWHVSESRSFARRFSDYLSVLLLGPVLIFLALGITASLTSSAVAGWLSTIPPFGFVIETVGRAMPFLMVIVAFTVINVFMPNARVQWSSAFIGAVVAGALWMTAGWLFASFVAGATNYTAIYSAFATIFLFMIWLYVSWLILLFGGSIAFYHQHPEYMTVGSRLLRMSNRVKELLALSIIAEVGKAFYNHEKPWTIDRLTDHLKVPREAVERVMVALEKAGFIFASRDDPTTYLPGCPLDTTEIRLVLDAIRRAEERSEMHFNRIQARTQFEDILDRAEQAAGASFNDRTLKDLALSDRNVPVAAPDGSPREVRMR